LNNIGLTMHIYDYSISINVLYKVFIIHSIGAKLVKEFSIVIAMHCYIGYSSSYFPFP